MDEYVQNSINVRKSTIYDNYHNVPPEVEAKIDDIFERMVEFGEKYTDVIAFENDFQQSDLNKEYIAIFTDLAVVNGPDSISFKDSAFNPKNYSSDDLKEMGKRELKEDARYLVKDAIVSELHKTAIERDQALRDIPVVGEIIQAKRTIDMLGRFRRRK